MADQPTRPTTGSSCVGPACATEPFRPDQAPVLPQNAGAVTRLDAPIRTPFAPIVERREPGSLALVRAAVEQGMSIDTIERLVALHERELARAAASEFASAIARFQAECPSAPRTTPVSYVTKAGGKVRYTYSAIDELARTARPFLHREGLSYGWTFVDGNPPSEVTTLRHTNGHHIQASFPVLVDSRLAEKMSPAQALGAAMKVAMRQGLTQVLGLTTCDDELLDGRGDATGLALITAEQEASIGALIMEVGADLDKFLAWLHLDRLGDCEARNFDAAVAALERKRNKA